MRRVAPSVTSQPTNTNGTSGRLTWNATRSATAASITRARPIAPVSRDAGASADDGAGDDEDKPGPSTPAAARVLITARSQGASPKASGSARGKMIGRTIIGADRDACPVYVGSSGLVHAGRSAWMTQHNDGTNLDRSRRSLGAKIKS